MARAIGAMALSACARFPRSCLGVMTATAGLAGVGGHHPPEPGRSGRQGNTSHCGIPFGKPTRVCGNRDWQRHGSPRDYSAEQRPLKAEISKVASTQINPVHLRHRVAFCIAGPRNQQAAEIKGADDSRPLWCLRATMKFFDRSVRGYVTRRRRIRNETAFWQVFSRSPESTSLSANS